MKKSLSLNPTEQRIGSDDVPPPVARSNSLLDNLVQNSLPADQPDSKLNAGLRCQWEPEKEDTSQDLATFLIQRACQNSALANYFYWYVLHIRHRSTCACILKSTRTDILFSGFASCCAQYNNTQ
jgi:hypothetical protein